MRLGAHIGSHPKNEDLVTWTLYGRELVSSCPWKDYRCPNRLSLLVNECERKQPRFLDFGAHVGDAEIGRKSTERN